MTWEPPIGFERALKRAFGPRAYVAPAASVTGLRLWKLTRSPDEYPRLPPELRAPLYQMGQAREEWFLSPRDSKPLPAIYEYDLKWAYVACATGQACGALMHDDNPTFNPHLRGFYRIRFTPPPDWRHVGLFRVPDGDGRSRDAPTIGTHETWAGWTEVILGCEYGWRVEILERIVWSGTGRKPLDTWRAKLLKLAEDEPEYAPWVRDVILHTIGQFHATRGRTRWEVVPDAAAIPTDRILSARPVVQDEPGGAWTYSYRPPLRPELVAAQHPEWSADIFARCRTRILRYQTKRMGVVERETGALMLPRQDVIGIYRDALWLACQPAWELVDIGDMRLKNVIPGPVVPPRSRLDVQALRQLMQKSTEGVPIE
jgi:hypothetical protein